MSDNEVLYATVEKNGKRNQLIIAIEECGELTQALTKHLRHDANANYDNIAEEIADVQIAIKQLQIIFGNRKQVVDWYNRKIERARLKLAQEDK